MDLARGVRFLWILDFLPFFVFYLLPVRSWRQGVAKTEMRPPVPSEWGVSKAVCVRESTEHRAVSLSLSLVRAKGAAVWPGAAPLGREYLDFSL